MRNQSGRRSLLLPMSKQFDQERAEKAVRELLIAIGEDPDRDGLKETPQRVARAMKENYQGLFQNPKDLFATSFDLGHEELVIVRDIEVFSHCEHHLTPFHGVAHVGYIPGPSGKVTTVTVKNPALLADVNVGEQVKVIYYDAMAASITAPKK